MGFSPNFVAVARGDVCRREHGGCYVPLCDILVLAVSYPLQDRLYARLCGDTQRGWSGVMRAELRPRIHRHLKGVADAAQRHSDP